MSQVVFSPNFSKYLPSRSLVETVTCSPFNAVSGCFAACSFFFSIYLVYVTAGVFIAKTLVEWLNQPRFRMSNNPLSSDTNAEVNKLYVDMLHCGVEGENGEIAKKRLAILLQNSAGLRSQEKALLGCINSILTRVGNVPSAETAYYDFERLYLDLCIQKSPPTDTQKELYGKLCKLLPSHLLKILEPVMAGAHSQVFDIRSFLVNVQINGITSESRKRYLELTKQGGTDRELGQLKELFFNSPSISATADETSLEHFLVWVDGNRFFSEKAKAEIKDAYKSASKTENPRQSFLIAIRLLTANRVITEKNAFYCEQQFDIVHSKSPQIPVHAFDAAAWSRNFQAAFATRGEPQRMLQEVGQATKRAAKYGYTVNGAVMKLNPGTTKSMQEGTKYYPSTQELSATLSLPKTTIEVINSDTLDSALSLKRQGYNVAVINMANELTPGGGFERGAMAQEEDEFRRSNYYQSLYPQENSALSAQMGANYRIAEKGVVYTPHLQVFRTNQASGFAFMGVPETVSAIAVAAYDLNPGRSARDPHSDDYKAGMKEKIKSFLRAALLNGHDAVVLSALGCGAFRNNPEVVALLFLEVLQSAEFRGKFAKVVFAILNDHNGANFQPFYRTLNGKSV